MALFTIARKKYLDRLFTVDELSAMVEMLRLWRLEKSPGCESEVQVDVECRISWFPRPQRESILNALRPRLPEANSDVSDPDEIKLMARTQSLAGEIDLALWRECLAEPLLKQACLVLRITFAGPLRSPDGSGGNAKTIFVMFGSAVDGAFLMKTIWKFNGNPVEERIYRLSIWHPQDRFLEAFEFYLRQCTLGPRSSAASLALRQFPNSKDPLFVSSRHLALALWLMRRRCEPPGEHGPAVFARRLGVPALIAAALIAVSLIVELPLPALVLLLTIAGLSLWVAARVILIKLKRVRIYFNGMRQALGILHTQPVLFQLADLSNNQEPSFLKCCHELLAMGAEPVCDFTITTARGVLDAHRMFRLGTHSVVVGVLRKYETFEHFPGIPTIRLTTRFEDEWPHGTVNQPIYRKLHSSNSSCRCLVDRGGVDETVALHFRHVDRLIAAGKVPSPPPSNPQQALKELEDEHALGNEFWKKFPYSWGDALHDAFKYCRREYLRD